MQKFTLQKKIYLFIYVTNKYMKDYESVGRRGIEPHNCEVIKFGIQLKLNNREKINEFFRILLKDRFLKIDYNYVYRRGFQIDSLLQKINKRYKKEFLESSLNILKELGCTNLVLEDNKYRKYHDIIRCDTPFGPRRIFALSMSFDNGYQYSYEHAIIGFRLMEVQQCGVLNFRTNEGGLSAVIEEDFTKHYDMIEKEILKISPQFNVFQFLFATTYH